MNLSTRIAKVEEITEPTFDAAIDWIEQRNPTVARVIKREFGKLKIKTDTVEIGPKMTLEEATKIYLDNLK